MITTKELHPASLKVLNNILREGGDMNAKRKALVRCAAVLLTWCCSVDLYTAMNLVESHVGVLNKILREPGDDDGKRTLSVRCAAVLRAWIDVLGSFMRLQ